MKTASANMIFKILSKTIIAVAILLSSFPVNAQGTSKPTAPPEQQRNASDTQQKVGSITLSPGETIEERRADYLKTLNSLQVSFIFEENWNHHLKTKYYADITPRLGKPKEFQDWVQEKRIRRFFERKFKKYNNYHDKTIEREKYNRIIVLQPDFKIWNEEKRLAPLQAEIDTLNMLLTDSTNFKEIQKAFYHFSEAYRTKQNGFQQMLQLSNFIHAITQGKEDAEPTEQFLHTVIPVFFAMASAPQKKTSEKAKGNENYLSTKEMRNLATQACYFVMNDNNNGQNGFVHKVALMSLNTLLSCQVHGYEDHDREEIRKEFPKQKGFRNTANVAVLCYLTVKGIMFKDKANGLIRALYDTDKEIPFCFSPTQIKDERQKNIQKRKELKKYSPI